MKAFSIFLAVVCLGLAAGCSSPCKELGNRICECELSKSSQDACKKRVARRLESHDTSSEEDSLCDELLGSCADPSDDSAMCDRLETAEGKADCGISYPEPTEETTVDSTEEPAGNLEE